MKFFYEISRGDKERAWNWEVHANHRWGTVSLATSHRMAFGWRLAPRRTADTPTHLTRATDVRILNSSLVATSRHFSTVGFRPRGACFELLALMGRVRSTRKPGRCRESQPGRPRLPKATRGNSRRRDSRSDRGSATSPAASTRTTEGRHPYNRLLRAISRHELVARAAAAAERVAYIRHARSVAFRRYAECEPMRPL